MDLCAAMRAFIRVAEARSFSGVAKEMNVAQSTVSKQIGALEDHLGVRLISRTTRTLGLTGEGRDFFERSCHILAAVAEAVREAVFSGVGVSAAPRWMFHHEMVEGPALTGGGVQITAS